MYLTLVNGVFNKGTKRADKNVEIDVDVIDEKDMIIPVSTVLLAELVEICVCLWILLTFNYSDLYPTVMLVRVSTIFVCNL